MRSWQYSQVTDCKIECFSKNIKQLDADQIRVVRGRLASERKTLKEERRHYETQRVDCRAVFEQDHVKRNKE